MNQEKHIRQINFDELKCHQEVDYLSDGIFFKTFQKISSEKNSVQIDMLTLIFCDSGVLQVDLNAHPFTLRPQQVLVCFPNVVIDNCKLSSDFEGALLCLSKSGLLEQIPEHVVWDKAFRIAENPIIQLREESRYMLKLYASTLMEKIKMKQTPFHKDVIVSIVKASLYEILGNVEILSESVTGGMLTSREVLFKRFIELLSSSRVKPRKVSWYAKQLCVTPKYLSVVVKRVSGKTAFYWVTEYIMIDIRYWLRNSNRSMKEIAALLNFPNISFFGKYCKAHVGMTPIEYRKYLRGLSQEVHPQSVE